MPKTKISQYDSTSAGANLNTDIAGINIDEGCAPSGINNAIRTLMAQIRDLQSGVSGDSIPVAAGGTGSTTASSARASLGLTIGTDVGGIATLETWTASQRGTVTTDNDGSFNMNVTNNFLCTPTGTFALTFTNITAGQSGYVLLVNTGGYAVTAAATTKVNTSFLTTVSTAGTYLLSYFTDGTNVYVTTGGAMA